MAEVVERVAKLEERFDGVTKGMAEVKESIQRVEARLDTGLSEIRDEIMDRRTELRSEMHGGFSELRTEIHTQFRWIMGGIGGAVLAILLAIVAEGLAR